MKPGGWILWLGNGDGNYGKLHAKFFISGDEGSSAPFRLPLRLYNNEMGFFFLDPDLAAEVHETFDDLISISYPGAHRVVPAAGSDGTRGMKGSSTKSQRVGTRPLRKRGLSGCCGG